MFPYYQQYNTQQYNTQQYPFLNRPTSQVLNGRMVTNAEEAKAAQIELDGSQWYFPCPAEGKIYSKFINNQGLPVFNVYKIENCQNVDMATQFNLLAKRVAELEKLVKEKNNEPTTTNDDVLTV